MRHISCLFLSLAFFVGVGCSQTWTPPRDRFIPPPPQFMVRTPHGLVPEREAKTQTAERGNQDEKSASRDARDLSSRVDDYPYSDFGPRTGRPIGPGSRTVDTPNAGPIYSQSYYVRPEHTSTGYIEGRYGRTDHYTPGEHTSTGYIPGNYRGDGNYTRPEHTSTGYIPGHYRADLQPDARTMIGVQNTPAVSSFRPYGR